MLRAQFAQLERAARFETTLVLCDELARVEQAAFTADGIGAGAPRRFWPSYGS